jgi:hypothetical protein
MPCQDIFAAGHDGALWRESYTGTWSGWTSQGGRPNSGPAAASSPQGIDVDNAVWHSSLPV